MTPEPDLTSPGPLIPAARHHAWLLEARELLRLAVPLAATQLAQMAILATDTIMLGHYSKEALAAGALGNTVFFLIWLVGCGIPMAVSPVIAHIQGAHSAGKPDRDRREVRVAVRMGLWSVAITSLPLMALLFFTQPILLFFRQEPSLAADAAIFVSALAIGLPFALGFQVLRSFSTALSRAVPPMVVLGLAILFNAPRRLSPDLRAFRFSAPGHSGRGLRQRQLQYFQLCRDAGHRAGVSRRSSAITSSSG